MTFEDWFYETEGFALRAERFYLMLESYHGELVTEQDLVPWLKAAYDAGREHEQKNNLDDGK